ncbi:MAG: toxin-antitoxin system HicB family antitoxin [Pseudomonadota bacterium]
MNKHIQIREVPEELHRKLKERAASQGMSMSDYLKRMIEQDLQRLSWDEWKARAATRKPIDINVDMAALVRDERDSR